MALSLGQVLGGAGAVARGYREEQDARQRSQQLALQTAEQRRQAAEQNRLIAMRDLEQQRTQDMTRQIGARPDNINVPPDTMPTRQIPQAAALQAGGAGGTAAAGVPGVQEAGLQDPVATEQPEPAAAGVQDRELSFMEFQGAAGQRRVREEAGRIWDAQNQVTTGAQTRRGVRGSTKLSPEQRRAREQFVSQYVDRLRNDYINAGRSTSQYGRPTDSESPAATSAPQQAGVSESPAATTAATPAERAVTDKPIEDVLKEVADLNVRPRAGVNTPAERIIPDSARYLANMETVGRDMQNALNQREQLVKFAQLYADVGKVEQAQELVLQISQLDQGMDYLQGMQGIQDLSLSNDPRRLAAVWSQYANVPIGIRPRSDGAYDIFVNGQMTQEGVPTSKISETARLAFDTSFRQQLAEASAARSQLVFEAQLKIEQDNANQLAQMIRETAVENVRGGNAITLEQVKAALKGYDVKPVGADGMVIITPPGGAPFIYNPSGLPQAPIDGVSITAYGALPISGLLHAGQPSYGTMFQQ